MQMAWVDMFIGETQTHSSLRSLKWATVTEK